MMSLTIKKTLLDKGIRQIDIAHELCVTRSAVSQFIAGKERSKRFDDWVMRNLGISMDHLRQQSLENVESSIEVEAGVGGK
mgnify:CR=1 FL=1